MKTKNEARAVLVILKGPEKEYNANSLSKTLGITSMGTLKILKRLEKEGVLATRKVSNISLYRVNSGNPYALDYASFLLKDEAEHSPSHVKRWITEVRKAKEAEIAVVFGSVLNAGGKARDIDVLFVVSGERLGALQGEIGRINSLNEKSIHPVFQTRADLLKNIRKGDSVILNAVKGVVAFGEREFVCLMGGAV